MLAYVAESAASAPPPRPGPPLIPPPRASSVPVGAFEAGLAAGFSSGGSELDEDAQPAFASAPAFPDVSAPPPGDEDGPPIEEIEAQMRGEISARDESVTAAPAARRAATSSRDDEDDSAAGPGGKAAPLPELDDLIARLPAEVRETLDELFRARFVSVKKLPGKVFRSGAGKSPPSAPGAAA